MRNIIFLNNHYMIYEVLLILYMVPASFMTYVLCTYNKELSIKERSLIRKIYYIIWIFLYDFTVNFMLCSNIKIQTPVEIISVILILAVIFIVYMTAAYFLDELIFSGRWLKKIQSAEIRIIKNDDEETEQLIINEKHMIIALIERLFVNKFILNIMNRHMLHNSIGLCGKKCIIRIGVKSVMVYIDSANRLIKIEDYLKGNLIPRSFVNQYPYLKIQHCLNDIVFNKSNVMKKV